MAEDDGFIRPGDTGTTRFICSTCGFMYDPEAAPGGIDPGAPPHTPFGALPESWACPLCGSGRDAFESADGKKLCNRWD